MEPPPEEQKHWPPSKELEKWLMNTVKDADHGSKLLQQILHMNPAYGAYLTADEDLAEIVQLFAKRFRAIFLASDKPIQPVCLYQPLCEVTWRVVGHVLHAILNLQESEGLPVPNEALGMVKMLLKTNIELSKRFNEMRRAYLRELTAHRDKQRILSEQAQMVVQSLQDHPVMFLEPLDFILDDTTKDFVRQVVEERVKLEMRSVVVDRGDDIENKRINADLENKLRLMEAEMKTLRSANAREMDARKRLELMEGRWKEEVTQERSRADMHLEEYNTANGQLPPLRQQLKDRMKELQALQSSMQGSAQDVASQLANQANEINELKMKLAQLEQAASAHEDEIALLKEQLSGTEQELEKKMQELEESQTAHEKAKKDFEKEIANMEDKVQKAQAEAKKKAQPSKETPVVKEVKKEVTKEVTKVVESTEELEKQRKQHLKIEEELRKAIKVLEKALEEEKKKNKVVVKNEKPSVDAEIQQAIQKVTQQYEQNELELKAEIKELKTEIKDLKAQLKAETEKAPKVVEKFVEKSNSATDDEKLMKWKLKAAAFEEERDDLQQRVETLERDMRMLLEKLKQVGGEQAVAEIVEKIKLTPMPVKKQRKKKAYERLYDDAQRRIVEMRLRVDKVQKMEEQSLVDAAKKVKDRRSLRQAEVLNHLHQASVATRSRFHDALNTFHEKATSLAPSEHSPRTSPDATMTEERDRSTSGEPPARIGTGAGTGEKNSALLARFAWIFDADPEIVIMEMERLKEENQAMATELEYLRNQTGRMSPRRQNSSPVPSQQGTGMLQRTPPNLLQGTPPYFVQGTPPYVQGTPPLFGTPEQMQTHSPLQPTHVLQSRPLQGRREDPQFSVGSGGSATGGRRGQSPIEMSSYPTFAPLTQNKSQPGLLRRASTFEVRRQNSMNSRPTSRANSPPTSPTPSAPSKTPHAPPAGLLFGQTVSPNSAAQMLLATTPAPSASVLPPWKRAPTPPDREDGLTGSPVPPGWNPAMSPLPPGQGLRGIGPETRPYVPGRSPLLPPGQLEPIHGRSNSNGRTGSHTPKRGRHKSNSNSPPPPFAMSAMEDWGTRHGDGSLPLSRSVPNLLPGPGSAGHDGYRNQVAYKGTSGHPRRQQRPILYEQDYVKPFTNSFVVVPLRSQEHMQAQPP